MSSPTKKFRISELKVVVSSEQAPVGTLLQIREQKLDIIGMRCEIPVNGSRRPYFLPLRGDQRGELIEGALLTGPALDVSDAVQRQNLAKQPRAAISAAAPPGLSPRPVCLPLAVGLLWL